MNDPEVLVMRYEDLVGDPKKAEATVQAFVEERFNDRSPTFTKPFARALTRGR